MKVFLGLDTQVVTKEAAQDWLEREQFNIIMNGEPSSNKYTIDQIRSFINTPMRDGQSLLGKYLDWNNIKGVELLINIYGARVEVGHFKIVREKLANPFLHDIPQNMLKLPEEAQGQFHAAAEPEQMAKS